MIHAVLAVDRRRTRSATTAQGISRRMNNEPDVDFFRARLIAYDFRRHPGNCASETHFRADLVPLATRTEIANLDHLILAD